MYPMEWPVSPAVRSTSTAHRPVDCLLLLRREGHRRTATLELLHVDPGVVTPLNRRHHHPRAGRVEQREGSGLVAARVLVGVVADDRRVPDRGVDAAVDAGEP